MLDYPPGRPGHYCSLLPPAGGLSSTADRLGLPQASHNARMAMDLKVALISLISPSAAQLQFILVFGRSFIQTGFAVFLFSFSFSDIKEPPSVPV